jgi:hypothetical protein
MKQTITMLVMAAAMMLMAGCSGVGPIRPAANSQAAAAYGNISLPQGHITHVMLYKVGEVYAPPFKSPPEGHTYTNGDFFFENLESGEYFLVGFMSGQDAFYFNYRGIEKDEFIKEVAVNIRPGSITYLGSYNVTGIDRNFIKTDTFDIERSDTPSKNTVLNNLKEAAAGTGWDQRIARAIEE